MTEIQNGFALVIVLWILALLTLMVGGYSATMRMETQLTGNYLQSAQAGAIAEAGVWLATQELQKPDTERRWRPDNKPYNIKLFDGKITLQIQNESGKIDLNTARPELLRGLLESSNSGQSDQKLDEILQAILDWRDRDNLTRINGAEDDDYKIAGYPYGSKDGPFNSIDELRLVMGMTDALYRNIAGELTVYSHQQGINPLFAGRKALMAVPGMYEQSADDYMSSRNGSPLIDNKLLTNNINTVFTITCTGIVSGTRSTIVTVVLFARNASQPYAILSWKET